MLSRYGAKLAIGLLKLFALLPYGLVARLGDGLGWLLYQIRAGANASSISI